MKNDTHEGEDERAASAELRLAETAHELANVVTSIAHGVDVALSLPQDPALRGVLEGVRHGVELLMVLVRRLRSTTADELEIGSVDPRAALDGAMRLAEPRLAGRVIVEREDAEAPMVRADVALLQQALLNLILNAVEAFPVEASEPARIRLATRTDASGYAALEIEDNGPGIPEEHFARVFEPLYTTKPGGSGLGLPLCQRAVESMGGTLSVQSRPGCTTFVIRLPPAVV